MEIASSCKNGASRCLLTQQCRLRHLRAVSGRNVTLTLPEEVAAAHRAGAQLVFYFTLHVVESSEALYTSEMICDITDLNFKSFNWSQLGDSINLSLSYIVVKLYAKLINQEVDPVLLLSQCICFRALRFLGEQVPKDDHQFPPNTLVFEMFEGFYSKFSDSGAGSNIPNKGAAHRLLNLEVKSGTERKSYDLSTLKRVQMVQRAIRQTRASVFRVHRVINDNLATTQETDQKRANNECIVSRLSLLRDELENQRQVLEGVQKQCHELRQRNQDQSLELVRSGLVLRKSEEGLIVDQRHLIDTRENLSRTNTQLNHRRRQLVSELSNVYPIEQVGEKKYTICNIHLPDSEDFYGRDDVMISVSLGYVAHLVTMISQFLQVPSRYPTLHLGTKSRIYDHFLSTIPENEREFPLYLRKKREDLRFKYGVYLLNKNISQLRLYNGLGTPDLRLTLQNLKALLELRPTSRLEQSVSSPLDIERRGSLSIFKPIPRLSEDPSGSNDSLNMGGSRQHSSPLRWHQSPKGLRPASLSLSLDHGLDELSSELQSSVGRGGGGGVERQESSLSTELRLSQPSLLDKTAADANGDIGGKLSGALATPFRVYANESDEPVDRNGT